MYIDSHAHLTASGVFEEIEGILMRAKGAGVEKIVNICTDHETLTRGIALKARAPFVYNTAATTPHDVDTEGESFFPIVEQAVAQGQLIAIGETGLDYHYEHSNRKTQQEFLLRYFALGLKSNLPLIFHCREAFADLFALADAHYGSTRGLLHCFTGTVEEAKAVVDRGWYLSISGIATFKKSQLLRDAARAIPLEHLLVETDTPYLAPQSHRGKRNEPAFITETVAVLADTLGKTVEEVALATRENAERFFSF